MRELSARTPEPRLDVLVVCDDDDTLIRLRDYLTRAGVQPRATRRLGDAWAQCRSSDALVLLPDDFDAGEITDGLVRVLSRPQAPFVIVVTGARQMFEPLVETYADAASMVIMPKPVWGWTILDLLRSRQQSGA